MIDITINFESYNVDLNLLAKNSTYFNGIRDTHSDGLVTDDATIHSYELNNANSADIRVSLELMVGKRNHQNIMYYVNRYNEINELLKYFSYKKNKKLYEHVLQYISNYGDKGKTDRFIISDLVNILLSAEYEFSNCVVSWIMEYNKNASVDVNIDINNNYVQEFVNYMAISDVSITSEQFINILNILEMSKNDRIHLSDVVVNFKQDDYGLLVSNLDFNMTKFLKNLEEYTYGLFDKSFVNTLNWDDGNMFIGGGSIVNILKEINSPWSDIDIWLYDSNKIELKNKLQELLRRIYDNIGYRNEHNNIAVSVRNNVITLYVANYKRNIQIVLTESEPINCMNNFDMDYVKCIFDGKDLIATKSFLESFITNSVKDIDDNTRENRIIKALIKNYRIECNENVKLKYDINKTISNYFNHKSYDKMDLMIKKTYNKYYYPSHDDFKDKDRMEFMIYQLTNHKLVFYEFCDVMEYIDQSFDKITSNNWRDGYEDDIYDDNINDDNIYDDNIYDDNIDDDIDGDGYKYSYNCSHNSNDKQKNIFRINDHIDASLVKLEDVKSLKNTDKKYMPCTYKNKDICFSIDNVWMTMFSNICNNTDGCKCYVSITSLDLVSFVKFVEAQLIKQLDANERHNFSEKKVYYDEYMYIRIDDKTMCVQNGSANEQMRRNAHAPGKYSLRANLTVNLRYVWIGNGGKLYPVWRISEIRL